MGFSKEWDDIYKKNLHMSIWPWSDLISYIMNYARPSGPEFKVLELGCGAGANIPFFKHLGVKYYAIDGSRIIIENLKKRFPELEENLICGDFTKNFYFKDKFDLIVDRGSLTSNSSEAIKRCANMIYDNLKLEGKFVGIDWYSTEYTEYQYGEMIENDPWSKTDFKKGYFIGLGTIHFSNKEHILEIFNKFKIKIMEHKIITTEIPKNKYKFASWNFVAIKES